jgi:hypothetical protein
VIVDSGHGGPPGLASTRGAMPGVTGARDLYPLPLFSYS